MRLNSLSAILSPPVECTLATAVLLWSAATHAAPNRVEGFPELQILGTSYPNACAPGQLKELRQGFLEAHPSKPGQLWKLIDIMLCGEGNADDKSFIRTSLPKRLKRTSAATGDDDLIEYVQRSDDLIDQMLARRTAMIANVSRQGQAIRLSYQQDDACAESRTFSFSKSAWPISEIGGTCD